MKHIDLTAPLSHGLAQYMLSLKSNSFGDQIIELKVLRTKEVNNLNSSPIEYQVLRTVVNCEGEHLSHTDIIKWGSEFVKGLDTV